MTQYVSLDNLQRLPLTNKFLTIYWANNNHNEIKDDFTDALRFYVSLHYLSKLLYNHIDYMDNGHLHELTHYVPLDDLQYWFILTFEQ